MQSRSRLLKSLPLLVYCLVFFFTDRLVYAEGKQVPDGSRTWTNRDGRTAELRYLKSDGKTVVLTDITRQRVFHAAVTSLSDADQSYVRNLSIDGTRVWTHVDETSRRMRFIAVEADKVVFEVPNVGRRSILISNLIPADRALLSQLASKGSSMFVMRFQNSPTVVTAANQLPNQQIIEAVNAAFENDVLKQALKAIGSDYKFSAGKTEDAINITFGRLNVSADEATRLLGAVAQKAKPQVTQILGLREADAKRFGLTFKLVPGSGTGMRPGNGTDSGSGPVVEVPFIRNPEYQGQVLGSCFSDSTFSISQCERISCYELYTTPQSIATNCSILRNSVQCDDSCSPNWSPAECKSNRCGLGFARLRRGSSD